MVLLLHLFNSDLVISTIAKEEFWHGVHSCVCIVLTR